MCFVALYSIQTDKGPSRLYEPGKSTLEKILTINVRPTETIICLRYVCFFLQCTAFSEQVAVQIVQCAVLCFQYEMNPME